MKSARKSTILIVDDTPANIFALEQILIKPDRTILTSDNGKDALKKVLNEDIDLIILDVQMPDMDGFEVAQILKSGKRTKDIPIIFATAVKKEQRFMVKGLEEGAVDYLFKPLDPEVTEAKVSVLLQFQAQKRELLEKNLALERYALQINNSADIICIVNPITLEVEETNAAVKAILGYEIDEFKEKSILAHLTEESQTKVKNLSSSVKEAFSFETLAFAKNREPKWLHWNIISKTGLWFANIHDVSEIKKYEERLKRHSDELQAVNRELESFSYSVSHDLRAPLRAISGFSEVLSKKYLDKLDEQGKRIIGIITDNVVNMGQLIDDLLNFSRMSRTEMKTIPTDFDDMVKGMVATLTQENPENAKFVKIEKLGKATCDPNMIKQVWQNLISNALKYSSKKGTPEVLIGNKKENDKVIYFVKDNGVGFNMDYATKLFEVFQRLHGNDEFEGTGIGLAIVHRIIKRHGGNIWAESVVNEGATFYFTLPENKGVV